MQQPQANDAVMIAQHRARKAYEYIEQVNQRAQQFDDKEARKKLIAEYRTVVLKFPMRVKVNGLAYSLAFAYSKKGQGKKGQELAYRFLYEHLNDWLQNHTEGLLQLDSKKELIENIIYLKVNDLMWATHEVLKLIDWMKRFVGEDKNEG